ncbi:MAG: hypothetical protein MJ119_03550 [Lachnospiraceae bacterium]|nr:hypothetical protein [Lachnospiraceae bacterium]
MANFCEYCGNRISPDAIKCPMCGATNAHVVRSVGDQPVTIEEFQAWYRSKGLPPFEVTRFFIGEDYGAPRAFGIYKEQGTDKTVVYMNTNSGARKLYYEGTDEAYGVNLLFQRLKEEIIEQKMAAKKRRP